MLSFMEVIKTTIDKIKTFRKEYLNSLPEFQELFIEITVNDSDFFILKQGDEDIGYVIRNNEGVLIEFYLKDKYIPAGNRIFRQVLKELLITEIYCKSFDAVLLSNCLLNNLSYAVIGVLYRDYVKAKLKYDDIIEAKKAVLSSVELLQNQDDSIKELFETKEQLIDFIQNENVFEFYKNNEFIGCGMVLRTHQDYDYCDLGVWVHPSKRGNSFGPQILLNLREFACKNNMKPSCGCAIENIASLDFDS
jgi:hypothetical protein